MITASRLWGRKGFDGGWEVQSASRGALPANGAIINLNANNDSVLMAA